MNKTEKFITMAELASLENMSIKLKQANSLIDTITQGYFTTIETDNLLIQSSYQNISNMLYLAADMIQEQQKVLTNTIESIIQIYHEARNTTDSI